MPNCCTSDGPAPFSPSTETFTKVLLKNSAALLLVKVFALSILQGPHQVAYISRNTSFFSALACLSALAQSCSIKVIPFSPVLGGVAPDVVSDDNDIVAIKTTNA